MLVLTRHVNEDIILETKAGEKIVVRIGRIRPGEVRLCIGAPLSVSIIRGELEDPEDESLSTAAV